MDEISQALQKIARETGVVFIGTIISILLGFLSVTAIARFLSKAEYGVFSLALTILSVAFMIAIIGFHNSLPREIAFYKEKEPSKIGSLILTALAIVLLTSLAVTAFLIFGSVYIAQVFREKRLIYALKALALALPFSTLTGTFVAISQGFGRVREKVYFLNLLYPVLWLSLIVICIIFKVNFYYLFVAYVLAQMITFFALVIDAFRLRLFKISSINLKLGKELIGFSIPLMFTGIAGFLMTWMDTLMLGYYKTSEVVGLYNSATPLAKLLPIFLNCAGFIYPPLATALYAQGKVEELKRVYQVLTKWIFLATLPLFTMMFLFPEATIKFFFGDKYLDASLALQILAFGFMFHVLLGLNGWSLIVIKESNFVMYSTLISAVVNVVLNIILIPVYGIEGAAVATVISYFIMNIFNSLRLYQKVKVNPFSLNYIKILILSIVTLSTLRSLDLKITDVVCVVSVLVAFLIIYFLLILLSRSIDREDIELLLAIEKRVGIDLGVVRRALEKFV